MSKFDNINEIKENFEDNLNQSEGYFSRAKKAFANFDEFMQNPKIALGLWAAIVAASGTLGYDVYKNEFEKKVDLDMYKSSIADVRVRTTQMTDDFLRVPLEAATIRNIKYSDNIYELNNASNEFIKLSEPNKPHIYKNPFWPNNIISIYNKPNDASKYHPEHLPNTAIDRSNHIIDMDYNQTKSIAKQMKVPEDNQYLVDSYILFHEAAHASYSQSIPYAGKITNNMENELKSDISALILIGRERKEDFDYLIDKVIDWRMHNLSFFGGQDFGHNTAYGLMELKKAVNMNITVLDMAPENISQFSDMFVKELNSVNLSQHHVNSLKDLKIPTSSEIKFEINNDIRKDMYSSIYFYQVLEGQENNKYNRMPLPSLKDAFKNPDDIQKISNAIADRLNTNLKQDTLTNIVLQNSKADAVEATKKLTDMVNSKPALKSDFIRAIAKGNLIYMDQLQVNIEPVKKVEEEVKKAKLKQLEQNNQNELKRKVQLQKPTMNNKNPT